ncbi:MAG: DUF58 domain-containing protein [Woeseiaceae bacterium]|nr:DUF58 domain-containing protein [Woeseiaceae bacterium]
MSSTRWIFPNPFANLPRLNKLIGRRVRSYAFKRQGKDADVTALKPGRVYILPTGVGFVFALMTFVMLLGSMNYNNNLSFVLTFLLISVGLIAMHQCQRNIVGLETGFAGTDPVFAGQKAQFRIAVKNPSKTTRFRIRLSSDSGSSPVFDVPTGESRVYSLPVPAERRGWVTLDRFGVRTLFPFEMFRSWAWLHMDIRGLVYPKPAEHAPRPPSSQSSLGHRQHDARGEEDFAGLRKFHPGDSPRNVAWKAYARNDQLLSKQFAGADMSSQWFDFDEVRSDDVEERLSILTRWIIDADRTREDYGLKLPGMEIAPSHGEAHRHACLEALALYGLDHGEA